MNDGFWEAMRWFLNAATQPIWGVVLCVVVGIIVAINRTKGIRSDRERSRSEAAGNRDDT